MISKHLYVATTKKDLKDKKIAWLHMQDVQRDLNPIFLK